MHHLQCIRFTLEFTKDVHRNYWLDVCGYLDGSH
jgi:hypothetical protein